MKRVYLTVLFCLLFLFFMVDLIAQKPQGSTLPECSPPTDVNNPIMFLSPQVSKDYIINYREKHKRKPKTHTRSIYFKRGNFCFISNFFNAPQYKDYKGVRIHFSTYKKKMVESQSHKKEITIFFTPTLANKEPDYEAFTEFAKTPNALKCNWEKDSQCEKGTESAMGGVNHGELCPEKCDDFTDDWGPPLPPPPSPPASTSVSAKKPAPPIVLLKPNDAKRYAKNYKRRYCFLWNKKHTKSIYLIKENFMFIEDFFRDNPCYDGIRVFFASYNKVLLTGSQAHKKQIVLILVPTMKGEPDFCAFINYFNSKPKSMYKELRNINHGELCPEKCPSIGP